MCRIAYNPSSATKFKKKALAEFFTKLENVAGRDGNGVYLIDSDKLEKHLNKMPSADIEGSWIFHTRIGTSGKKKVYNNQPLVGKRYILTHNGSYYRMDDLATLLGYVNPNKKYSDSHMANFIIHKVGILNFWLCLKESSAGVFLIYDKQIKQTFLCKFSGSFEYAKFKDGDKFIYASSNTDFWDTEKPEYMKDGLYRLYDNHFELLDKKKEYIYIHTSAYTPPSTKRSRKRKRYRKRHQLEDNRNNYLYCHYCSDLFIRYQPTYTTYGHIVCIDCFRQYGTGIETDKHGNVLVIDIDDKEDEDVIGIGALFNSSPAYCTHCKWNYRSGCWFGGSKRDDFIKKVGISLSMCHTSNVKTRNTVLITCDNCVKSMKLLDNWEMYKGEIVCRDCIEEREALLYDYKQLTNERTEGYGNCSTCIDENTTGNDEPCRSCSKKDKDGKYCVKNWKPKLLSCKNCHFKGMPRSYPCRICTNFDNWTDEDDDEIDDIDERQYEICKKCLQTFSLTNPICIDCIKNFPDYQCYHCGYHFDDDDERTEDKNGHLTCYRCDDGLSDELYAYRRHVG